MKHVPKPLISFRQLQGGQFGTLDVQAMNPQNVQLELGSDFIWLTRSQWIALRCAVDRFFRCETETVILEREDREGVIYEEEEVEVRPQPPARSRVAGRRRSATG